MEQEEINFFLTFGYFTNYNRNEYSLDLSKVNKNTYLDCSEEDLLDIGVNYFVEAISNDFEPNKKHLVPISGGLDSRAILAGLLEFTEAKNIHTYTFGTPGTLDYDIGGYIAKKIGTSHKNYPLTRHTYQQAELLDISNRVNHQTVLFHHPPIWEIDRMYSDFFVWSGYAGDGISGGYLPEKPASKFLDAQKNYIDKFKYVKSISLSSNDNSRFIEYLSFQPVDKETLSYEEQLYFNERLKKFIAPHVLMKGYMFKTPFINNKFMNFMLSIDNHYRQNQRLYVKIMSKAFPHLFNLKTKANYGLHLKASKPRVHIKKIENKIKSLFGRKSFFYVNPYINYIDFRNGIREREDLNSIFKINISDLKSRNIINSIDIEEILNRHFKKNENFSDILIALTSLEIHLKSQGRKNDDEEDFYKR